MEESPMTSSRRTTELSDATVAVVRAAADALVSQDGRGIRRRALIDLGSEGTAGLTVLDGDPPVAVVHPPEPGTAPIFAALTPRERQLADLIAAGMSNAAIAAHLVVSVATVKDHVHRILRKTGLASRAAVGAAWRG
jgi:DNA-binding NarL/FixJ family response regulator